MNNVMGNIKILSDNYYYRLGVYHLLDEIYHLNSPMNTNTESKELKASVVIFRENVVSLQYHTNNHLIEHGNNGVCSLDIPFICSDLNLDEIRIKLEKIALITRLPYFQCDIKTLYQRLGIKEYQQLSSMEYTVLSYYGKGYGPQDIALKLDCSEKNVNTHCRNAMRKMGMLKRMELYQYASVIASNDGRKRITLCL
ncbi:LuxR family transcriptional regulator [Lelliottia amnigena]|uniref:LuxR family transcriptional regulator n=1 Tax=Lelliottia amnigena TaxID=61646 RepID=UPI0021D7FB02|nr:LuxR family transcriptional regulator [Lelliottia amnigena]MCU7782098.1 LuxR family transcriptional regulator [Lelliottia amnigena]